MILKMSAVTLSYIIFTVLLYRFCDKRIYKTRVKVLVGVVFGLCAIMSTHFGIDYGQMMVNVRDIGPLAAGLFFSPLSGIIAGLIGGIERYIAGTYFGVGSYTTIACSVSTCLAGFLAAFLNMKVFKGKKPSVFFAFFLGAVMEVFHMYSVFITHRDDMKMAFYVVSTCAIPMETFTAIGMAGCALALLAMTGKLRNPFKVISKDKRTLSDNFTIWMAIFIAITFIFIIGISVPMQNRTALQTAEDTMETSISDVKRIYRYFESRDSDTDEIYKYFHSGESGKVYLADEDQIVELGITRKMSLEQLGLTKEQTALDKASFRASIIGRDSYCRIEHLDDGKTILATIPMSEVFRSRDAALYEFGFAAILIFTLIFVLMYILVQKVVVNNLENINNSLAKITNGDLDEEVQVRTSSEFTSLSNDINMMVSSLKGYIAQAEKRIEEELEFARSVQNSALPRTFKFPGRDEFDLYALMDPAKEVGGDFYDCFFMGGDQFVLVVADVSGKGIPASLLMMRSKTAIKTLAESGRSPSEIFEMTNDSLCEGNDNSMFVTAWIGIIDLKTGIMKCANAGHEYPAIKHQGWQYELFKDEHSLPLAAMEGVPYREYELVLQPGDEFFVYTDGVPEAINEATEQYGTDRMLAVLNEYSDIDMEKRIDIVREDIRKFVGEADQFDDITMLGFELNSK